MPTVQLGAKHQIVIPKDIREVLGLRARDKLLLWVSKDHLEAVPLKKHRKPLEVLDSISRSSHRISLRQLEEEAEQRH